MSENKSNSNLAFIAGLAVGALAGLLFAPETGEDTRKKLGDKSKELADDLYDKFDDFKDSMLDVLEDVKESTAETLETVKSNASAMLDDVKAKTK
ncbi:MAG: YtxH domain-containing protein [Bacteroidota bacterium]